MHAALSDRHPGWALLAAVPFNFVPLLVLTVRAKHQPDLALVA